MTHVPLVACRNYAGNGGSEDGDLPDPGGKSLDVQINVKTAQKLAYYQSPIIGLLAPRGWFCIGYSGTSGAHLYVTPKPIKRGKHFNGAGDAIIATLWDASTSGRFSAAEIVARLFPAYHHFPETVMKEGLRDPNEFTFHPYPDDRLNYLSDSAVEVETPARAQGLGTENGFKKDDDPIDSVAILAKPPDQSAGVLGEKASWEGTGVLILNVRFKTNRDVLTPEILRQFEQTHH